MVDIILDCLGENNVITWVLKIRETLSLMRSEGDVAQKNGQRDAKLLALKTELGSQEKFGWSLEVEKLRKWIFS